VLLHFGGGCIHYCGDSTQNINNYINTKGVTAINNFNLDNMTAAAKIRRGDIVVARHTDPGWTPILSVIGGIIMEEGGLLNHCSIVARELGIPSIVGVSRATQLIPEGVRVTIDGGAGMVRIEKD